MTHASNLKTCLSFILQVTILSISFLSIFSVAHGDNTCEDDIILAITRLRHFPNIAEWEVSVIENEIRLVSKFDVFVSSSFTIQVEEFDEEKWKKETLSKFWISIRFQPQTGYENYRKLRNERQKWTDLLNEDYQALEGEPLSDAECDEAWENIGKTTLPSHIAADSNIFIESPLDSPDSSFNPDDSLQKCVWMLYRLNFLFSKIIG